MDSYDTTRIIISICLIGISFIFVLGRIFKKRGRFSAHFVTSVAIFAALSTILYIVPIFNFSLPIFPAFLSIHLDEIPAFIAGFAYGPWAGFFVIIIKTIIKLPMTSTLCVGELADLIYSVAFVIPGCIIYRKLHNFKGALLGLFSGFIIQLVVSSFFTTFVMLDFYMFVMGFSYDMLLSMCQAVNPLINNLSWPFLLYVALPFNALKDLMVIVLTIILYKGLHTIIDKLALRVNKN